MAKWKTLCQDVSITMARWRAESLTADKVHCCCLNRLKLLERLGLVGILRPERSRTVHLREKKKPYLERSQDSGYGQNKQEQRQVSLNMCGMSPCVSKALWSPVRPTPTPHEEFQAFLEEEITALWERSPARLWHMVTKWSRQSGATKHMQRGEKKPWTCT